jgi:deoxycytidylate deaminase
MKKLQILKLLSYYEQKSNCPKRAIAAMIIPQGLLKHDWLDPKKDLIRHGTNSRVLMCSDHGCELCLDGYKGRTCPAIHAEAQCLIGVPFSETHKNTLIVSWSPCPECCKLIKSAGISRVIIKEPRLKKPSKADCNFYNATTYDELAERLLHDVQYIRLWEQEEDWEAIG